MTPPAGYTLAFEDAFDTLDLSKWKATSSFSDGGGAYNWNRGYGAELWDPTHVAVSGGLLALSASLDMHSGEVRSLQSFGLGYYEVRAKLPATVGFWPACWLMSSAGTYQEIDTVECSSASPSHIGMNLHWVAGDSPGGNGGWTDPAGVNYQAGFHTYGVLYAADRIDFFVDDVLRRHWAQLIPQLLFDSMQLRLSLSIFGPNQAWAAPPDTTTVWPGVMLVDYVRVYTPGPAPVTPPADTTASVVAITAPVNGSTVTRKSTVRIVASVSDNTSVAKVDFLINGHIVRTVTAAPYTYDWLVSAKRTSTYTIEAMAWDTAGNNARSSITVRAA